MCLPVLLVHHLYSWQHSKDLSHALTLYHDNFVHVTGALPQTASELRQCLVPTQTQSPACDGAVAPGDAWWRDFLWHVSARHWRVARAAGNPRGVADSGPERGLHNPQRRYRGRCTEDVQNSLQKILVFWHFGHQTLWSVFPLLTIDVWRLYIYFLWNSES